MAVCGESSACAPYGVLHLEVQLELRLEAEPRICKIVRKFVLNYFLLSFIGFSLF